MFIAVAILQEFRNQILWAEDSIIPQTILQIHIDSLETVESFMSKAKEMRKDLPYSIYFKLKNYDVYNLNTIDSLIEELKNEKCLSIMPREIMQRNFPECHVCFCANGNCCWCKANVGAVNLVVLDVRDHPQRAQGTIPNSALVISENTETESIYFDSPDRFVGLRGITHFALLTDVGCRPNGGTKFSETEEYEQRVLDYLLDILVLKGFPKVSIIEGGYLRCHQLAMHFNLKLENHSSKTCKLCSNNSKTAKAK